MKSLTSTGGTRSLDGAPIPAWRDSFQKYVTKNGELQIALIDTTTEQVLWVVSATDTIKGKSKKAEEKIDKIIEKVFEDFPVEKLS